MSRSPLEGRPRERQADLVPLTCGLGLVGQPFAACHLGLWQLLGAPCRTFRTASGCRRGLEVICFEPFGGVEGAGSTVKASCSGLLHVFAYCETSGTSACCGTAAAEARRAAGVRRRSKEKERKGMLRGDTWQLWPKLMGLLCWARAAR